MRKLHLPAFAVLAATLALGACTTVHEAPPRTTTTTTEETVVRSPMAPAATTQTSVTTY